MSTLQQVITEYQARVERSLERWLPAAKTLPTELHKAMRYSVLGGGKRIRPLLVYLAGQTLGCDKTALDGPACAVEMIHAYSLIHDDLPAMDDDDLRRGKPACHKAYGEAMAILAGDALQSLAFHILAQDPTMGVQTKQRLAMVNTLAQASGSHGMVGGQAVDLLAEGQELTLAELENMHILKTGMLIRASVKLGALCQPNVDSKLLKQLDHYAKCVGLAFQIRDDILDIEADTDTLGKPQGADILLDKPTYPALLGMAEAKQRAQELHEDALASLADFGAEAEPLRQLSRHIIERTS
ncbi:MAG: (2E,6E)-farnesyl diphosphate synthase [Gammaproteobacteria bacterium]|nr:(2E,6E)-farnesyl diphosphate synthase [Gammaproteobacteria bacterium]